jgi:hypothetical protein
MDEVNHVSERGETEVQGTILGISHLQMEFTYFYFSRNWFEER